MSLLMSPGVAWKELDFSSYAVELATSIFGVVGQARKGKIGVNLEFSGVTDMVSKVGKPNPNFADYSLYALSQYFVTGRRALFSRIYKPSMGKTIETSTARFTVLDSGDAAIFDIVANSPGTYGNSMAFAIVNVDAASHEFDLVILDVDSRGTLVEVERFEAMTANPDEERYIESALNDGINGLSKSQYVVIDNVASWASQHPKTYASQVLDGGHDGDTPSASDYAGNSADRTGVYAFKDAESYDLNILGVPGMSHETSVMNAIQEVCEYKRKDCFGLIDPPYTEATPDDVKLWRQSLSYDTSYTSMFWPWCKIDDTYNNKKIWVPPSGFVAQRIAYSDLLTNPWIAFAGLNRGKLPGVLDIQYVTDQDQRDILYDRRININVIKREPGEGFVLWGNRTNQSKPSQLDRIHSRRMLLYLEKIVATSVKYLVFEPNDAVMWQSFKQLVTPVFQNVKENRGLESYDVIMDESTNTDLRRQRSEALGLMKVVPQGVAEMFDINFAIYPQGAKF